MPPATTAAGLGRYFAAGGSKENAPHQQVVAETFESMVNSRRDEQEVAWLEGVPLAVVKQAAPAASDDVDFILVVRRLFVRAGGPAKHYVKRAAPEDADGALTRRNAAFNFGKSHDTATVVRFHICAL
jgi:hypothetical protein